MSPLSMPDKTLAIPETSVLGLKYENQRELEFELFCASIQRQLAHAPNSPCKMTSWSSFNKGGCRSYHEFFPTAELIDMVSSPRHHPELYLDTLSSEVSGEDPLIWIPAFATSRTYDMARFAKKNARVIATDLCGTPTLALGNLFREDVSKGLLMSAPLDILKADYSGIFDAVVTDAFITRFSGEDKVKVLRIIYKALKPGGVLLTTIRIPQLNERELTQQAELESDESIHYVDSVIAAYKELLARLQNSKSDGQFDIDSIGNAAKEYQNSMKSNHALEERDMIANAFMPQLEGVPNMGGVGILLTEKPHKGGIGFTRVDIRISNTVYDITSRKYLQIMAKK